MWLKTRFFPFGGSDPFTAPQVPPGDQGYFFLIDTSFLLQDKYDFKKKWGCENFTGQNVCLAQSCPVKLEILAQSDQNWEIVKILLPYPLNFLNLSLRGPFSLKT